MPFIEIGKMDLEVPVPMPMLKDPRIRYPYYLLDVDRQTDALVADVSVISDNLAIIPDSEVDLDQWVLSNRPFLHVRVGMHLWEEIRAVHGPMTNFKLRQIFLGS